MGGLLPFDGFQCHFAFQIRAVSFAWSCHLFSPCSAFLDTAIFSYPPVQDSGTIILTALEQARYESHEREYAPLSVVECSIAIPGKLSFITLSIDSPEGAIADDLPAYDCVLAGPPITFRFDYMALRQVLVGTEGKVDRWHIRIDRNADVAQFVPEPPVFERGDWECRHQVWNVVG